MEQGHWGIQDAHTAHVISSTLPICLDSLILRFFLPTKGILSFITASYNILMDKLTKSGPDEADGEVDRKLAELKGL